MNWSKTPPTICIVGRSKSGKTTLLEKLIREFKQRGYRVATIKHHSHPGFEIDQPGKDTWRHAQAGSDHVVIAAPDKVAAIRRVDREPTLEEITATINGVDVILTEGYKRTGKLKVEIVRAERSTEPICTSDELLALVTDVAVPYDLPKFSLDDVVGLADLIETLM
ncbi:MAG: molybdopterin-guanine dinucleotide biosynthesis protein B [Chloroflexi bacterium]|nr:molybdopterin-guanine dinucleotide biosynthesis protein B [Chloroflexota bacterium]